MSRDSVPATRLTRCIGIALQILVGLTEVMGSSACNQRQLESCQHAPQLDTPKPQIQRSRSLRQEVPEVTIVRTAQEFVNAVERGDEHIEIREHLDMTGVSPLGNLDPGPVILGQLPLSVQSIRGNCEEEPDEALSKRISASTPPLRPRAPRQCVLTVDMPLLHTPTQSARSVWLDGLYLRFQRTARSYRFNFGLLFVKWASTKLWMTHMHLQGAGLPSDGRAGGDCANCGLYQWGDVYMKDCKFSDMSGDTVLLISRDEATAMHGCQFLNNTAMEAVVAAVTGTGSQGSAAAIERSTFANNTAPHLLQIQEYAKGAPPVYFTDKPMRVHFIGGGGDIAGETDSHALTSLPPGKVLSNDADSFLQTLQQELPSIPRASESFPPVTTFDADYAAARFSTAPVPAAPIMSSHESAAPGSSSPRGGFGSGALAGVIISAVVAVLLVGVAACFACWRRRTGLPVNSSNLHKEYSPSATSGRGDSRQLGKETAGGTSSNSRTSNARTSCQSRAQVEKEVKAAKSEGGEFLPGLPLLTSPLPSFNFLRIGSLNSTHRSVQRDQSAEHRAQENSLRAECAPDNFTKESPPPSKTNSAPCSTHNISIGGSNNTSTPAAAASASQKPITNSDRQESRGGAQSSNSANAKSCEMDTCDMDSTIASYRETLRPLAAEAGRVERLDFLRRQLESLAGTTVCEHLGGLLVKDGTSNRVQGGQAVVQFATHQINKLDYAMKFIVTRRTFLEESAQYTDPDNPLLRFLPQVHAIVDNEDGKFTDSCGNPMPPCIVMERGESLDMWMMRNRRNMDTYTCMQIIHHVCECLSDLHSGGYVHRDLKPGNVIWLPSQNRWTLIDFGCAAKQGEAARLGFSLPYAAPEVAKACYRNHQLTILADPSLDMWSLGVIAIELFSGRPALKVLKDQEEVIEQLVGEKPLPWEDETAARAMLATAARFRGAMLTLLHRDPAQRPSADAFMQHCHSLLASTTAD